MTGALGPAGLALSFQRVSIELVMLALFVLLVLAGITFFVARRRKNKRTLETQTDAEQLPKQYQSGRDTVPLRTKAWGVPTEAKWLTAVTLAVLVYIGFQVYTYLRTGSPTQSLYSWQAAVVVLVAVGMVGGYKTYKYVDGKYGRLEAIVESIPDEKDANVKTETMTLYFHVDDVVETESGLAVNRYSDNRFLFLFRLPLRHADIARLRENDDITKPGSEQATYAIPDRAHEIQPNVYNFRTKGQKTSETANTEVDVQWQPAFSMSYEEKKRREQDREKILADIREVSATNARLAQELERKEKALEAALEDNWEQFMEILEELSPFLGNGTASNGSEVTVPREVPQQITGRSQRDGAYSEAGDTTHAEAAANPGGDHR